MSTSMKIAVAEPSVIIRSGLLSVLGRLTTLNIQILEIAEIAQLGSALCRQKPDMLIVNPALLGMFSLQKIKSEAGCLPMKCIALQYSVTDSSTLKAYDQTISIYDTAEQIKESGAGTILDFIARMPGMSVVGRQVSYRGYRPGFMVDGRLEETVGEMNPVRAFRSTGMGRNHKTQTRLPPIPDPGGMDRLYRNELLEYQFSTTKYRRQQETNPIYRRFR